MNTPTPTQTDMKLSEQIEVKNKNNIVSNTVLPLHIYNSGVSLRSRLQLAVSNMIQKENTLIEYILVSMSIDITTR